MTIAQRLKFWITGKVMSFVEKPENVPIHRFTDYSTYLIAGCTKVWASWKSCDVTAQAVAETQMTITRAGKSEPVVVPGLTELLIAPNEFETWQDMLYKMTMHLKMTGNAFILKDESLPGGKRPKSLYLLNPKRVKIIPSKSDKVKGYVYEVNGNKMPIAVEDMMHFFKAHPDNDYLGLGDIEAGQQIFNESINRSTWSEKFWKNGASPSSLMILEDRVGDVKMWEEVKRKWAKDYGGVNNSGKTAWLNGKWRHEQLGLSNVEMQDLERSRWTAEQICHIHGVPLSVVGLREAANYATAKIDDVRWRRSTVKPIVTLITKTLQTDLIDTWAPGLTLAVNISGLVDAQDTILTYQPLFDRGGISINEMRELAGLQKLEDPIYDQHFISAAMVPLELAGLTMQSAAAEPAARMLTQNFIEQSLMPVKLPATDRNGNGQLEHQNKP